jgi:hypothetical protein
MLSSTTMDQAFVDIVLECAAALEATGFDGAVRDTHRAHIGRLLSSAPLESHAKEVLRISDTLMREFATNPPGLFTPEQIQTYRSAALQLRALVPPDSARQYVYHGTICGRLASIAEHGLIPGHTPVWKGRPHIETHSKSAVFFATSWRGAAWWADVTHFHSRGRRDSHSRLPAVIRVAAEGLAVEPDVLAAQPGCVLVHSKVSTVATEVFVGPLRGYPEWIPILSATGPRAPRT